MFCVQSKLFGTNSFLNWEESQMGSTTTPLATHYDFFQLVESKDIINGKKRFYMIVIRATPSSH